MRFYLWAPSGVLCALVGVSLVAASLMAQPVGATTTSVVDRAPVAITHAIGALWSDSAEVRAARAELEAARARARAAGQPLYNPELQLAAENADVDRRTVGLSLALDVSGKREARRAVGDAGVIAAQAAYDQVRRDVAARWLKAWFAAKLSMRESELGRHRVALMQRFADLAERRLKVGDVSITERDLAALALTEAQAQQAALLGKAAGSQAVLASLGGPVDTLDPPASFALPAPLGDHRLSTSQLSLEQLPELQQARARVAGADAGIRAAQRQRLPDPVLTLTGGRVRTGPGPGMSQNVVGLSLSVPLPIRNNYRAEVESARAESDAALAGLDAQRLALRARQRESEARYAALREASAVFKGSRAAAFDDRAALLERLWRAGEISTSDYLVQLKQSLDTALSGVTLENETWQAGIDHLSATGQLIGWVDANNKDASP
ncbi:TolC family protein [Dyella subtropica]|uniref:TolC family protein n=1 Tax=Dyella subtropica TaxID=2992127 RepID=UPI0022531200|nr:TolC family protein [Dyella subtropica]